MNLTIGGGPCRRPLPLSAQTNMRIIHAGLHAQRDGALQVQQFPRLAIAHLATVHIPPIHLLDTISIDRIVEKKRKIRNQIQVVILQIGLGKQRPAGWRVVAIPCLPVARCVRPPW